MYSTHLYQPFHREVHGNSTWREEKKYISDKTKNTHRLNETHNSRSFKLHFSHMCENGREFWDRAELNGAEGRSANAVRYGLLSRA